MTVIITFENGQKQLWYLVLVQELPTDLKPIMAWQIEELINELEDCEVEATSISSVRTIKFLDDCYQIA